MTNDPREPILRQGQAQPQSGDSEGQSGRETTLQSPPAKCGLVVPGYEIQEIIGQGGMGVVYAAQEIALGREVAIKFIQLGTSISDYAIAQAIKRFESEACITACLSHPCIPPVHAFGRLQDGRPYLVMKRIHGRTLHDLLEERVDTSRDLLRFVRIFEQVCQAVAFAHQAEVIHRDLKPLNVMVDAFGEVQVMDWGLAKRMRRQDSSPKLDINLTIVGQPMGTVGYMSPEQGRGEWDDVNERTDVFSLGAILCNILTRSPPCACGPRAESNLAAALKRLRDSGHDPGLIDIAVRCLYLDMDDRPSNASVVVKMVEEFRASVIERLRNSDIEKALAAENARREKAEAEEAARLKLELVKAEKNREIDTIKRQAKLSRQRRRRRLRTGFSVLLVMSLLALSGIAWLKYNKINYARKLRKEGVDACKVNDREGAIGNFKKAREEYEGLLGSTFLWNYQTVEFELAKVNLDLAKLHEDARDTVAAEAALRQAGELLARLRAAQILDRDELDLAQAEVHHNMGVHYTNMSEYQRAKEEYDSAVVLRKQIVGEKKKDSRIPPRSGPRSWVPRRRRAGFRKA